MLSVGAVWVKCVQQSSAGHMGSIKSYPSPMWDMFRDPSFEDQVNIGQETVHWELQSTPMKYVRNKIF